MHSLWCYPVKSLGGYCADSLVFDARGVAGDRAWAVITESGKIGSGKNTRRFERVDGLLELTARAGPSGVPRVRVSDGPAVSVTSPAAAELLSDALGRPVTLAPERHVPHFDVDGVHLLTRASLDWVRSGTGGRPVDERRFRPNVVVEGVVETSMEDAWVGRELALGSVRLRVNSRAERCVMVGMAQPGISKDDAILRYIAHERDACLGIYASVVAPGIAHVGDEVRVV